MRRRAPDGVPSPTRLDLGDLLVMDGLAQSEYVHRTVSGRQGHWVDFSFRPLAWASSPSATSCGIMS